MRVQKIVTTQSVEMIFCLSGRKMPEAERILKIGLNIFQAFLVRFGWVECFCKWYNSKAHGQIDRHTYARHYRWANIWNHQLLLAPNRCSGVQVLTWLGVSAYNSSGVHWCGARAAHWQWWWRARKDFAAFQVYRTFLKRTLMPRVGWGSARSVLLHKPDEGHL